MSGSGPSPARIGLRTKYLVGTVLIVAVTGSLLAFMVQRRFLGMQSYALQRKGTIVTTQMAETCIDPMLTRDVLSLRSIFSTYVESDSDIAYVYAHDADQRVLAHTFQGGFPRALVQLQDNLAATSHIRFLEMEGSRVIDVAVPLLDGRAGAVHAGFSENKFRGEAQGIVRDISVLILGSMIVAGAMMFLLSHLLSRPLLDLRMAVRRLGRGELEGEVPIRTGDEVGQLAAEFNLMAENLRASDRETNRAQEILARNIDIQARINRILRLSLGSRSLVELLTAALQVILEAPWLRNSGKGAFLEASEDGRELKLLAAAGFPGDEHPCRVVAVGTCHCGRAAAGDETLFVSEDEDEHGSTHPAADRRAHYCVPVRGSEGLVGVINLHLSADHTRDEAEIRFLEAIAHALAAVLQRERSVRARQEAHAKLEQTMAALGSALIAIDETGAVTSWNRQAEKLLGLTADEVVGRELASLDLGWDWPSINAVQAADDDEPTGEFLSTPVTSKAGGAERILEIAVSPMRDAQGERAGSLLLGTDVTERRALEDRLAFAEKMESIGRLSAGIAHEINTPIQYVGDNTAFLADAFTDLQKVLASADRLRAACEGGDPIAPAVDDLQVTEEAADRAFLEEEIPQALEQTQHGLQRVAGIVKAMRNFAHQGTGEKVSTDLNECITSTLTVARNQWKYRADVQCDLDPGLPLVPCLPAEFNQAVLNLIINASHAIDEVVRDRPGAKGTIEVGTRLVDRWVEIRISDSGCGMPDAVRDKVFEPFFTTKEVGKGTGQGLAITRSVIVEKLGGTIEFETEVGQGTTFIIRLPTMENAA